MPNEPFSNDLADIWQRQPVEPIKMSADELRQKAKKFQNRIRARNLLEYAAGVYVVLASGSFLLHAGSFPMRLGSILMIAGVLYVTYQIYRKGSAKPLPQQMGLTPCLEFHRRELERQRDLLLGVWHWYLAPLVPGLAVTTFAGAFGAKGITPRSAAIAGVYSLAAAALFYFIWNLNQKAALKIQRQINELE